MSRSSRIGAGGVRTRSGEALRAWPRAWGGGPAEAWGRGPRRGGGISGGPQPKHVSTRRTPEASGREYENLLGLRP